VPPSRKIPRRRIVYSVLVNETPVVAFKRACYSDAQELLREDWFLEELKEKRSSGRPISDGKGILGARSARPAEHAAYEGSAPNDAESGEVFLVYLVSLDE
jgi:hypothetical protein